MSDSLAGKIEALLFVAGKPLPLKEVARMLSCGVKDIEERIVALNERYEKEGSGLRCVTNRRKAQLTTSSETSEAVADFLRAEQQTELTRPSLETLSIVAYRGPILKEELEHIRGVNCSLILRNLMIRGLIEEVDCEGGTRYEVTHDFLRFLGVKSPNELPEYEKLHTHEDIEALLEQQRLRSQ